MGNNDAINFKRQLGVVETEANGPRRAAAGIL